MDEPELGLHPAAIGVLAEMARVAGRSGHRVILATHSVPLVSHFNLREIIILDRTEGATQASRPDEEFLGAFLEDYSTGSWRHYDTRLHDEYPDSRFRPLVVLHEIEALVLAAIDAGWGKG